MKQLLIIKKNLRKPVSTTALFVIIFQFSENPALQPGLKYATKKKLQPSYPCICCHFNEKLY